MISKIRRRLSSLLSQPNEGPGEINALRQQLDAVSLELRELVATAHDQQRSSLESTRREIDTVAESVRHVAAAHAEFDSFVRAWVPESVDAARTHLEVRLHDEVKVATSGLTSRIRRAETMSRQWQGRSTEDAPQQLPNQPNEDRPAPPARFSFDYSALEDQLRGSVEQVKEMERVHVTTIESFGAASLSVLDVGCGRGELLEMLGEAGVAARGIDLNAVSVAEAVDLGLDVIAGDAIAHLNDLVENSLRCVVGLHIVEHLDEDDRAALLRAAFRAVAPGGGVIFETPNPENVRVGATTFWLDPTHIRPIPPQLLQFQIQEAGFESVEIQRLHPAGDALSAPEGADEFTSSLVGFVNRLAAGPMDYAVIGRKSLGLDDLE